MIRPSEKEHLSPGVLKGVDLHQSIDRFTDGHEGFRRIRNVFTDRALPYGGVLADIVMDHCLASRWSSYCGITLEDFAQKVYELLQKGAAENLIPGRFNRMAQHLVEEDWFVSYSSIEGLEAALGRLNYRSSRRIEETEVLEAFIEKEKLIRTAFEDLMRDMLPCFAHSI